MLMKKILTLCFCSLVANFLAAQQFVSNTNEPKNVLLEQVVGLQNDSTTLGQAQINILSNARPNRYFNINIHTGTAAFFDGNPAFQTQIGNDLYAYLNGNNIYYRTTINRQPYSNSYWIEPDLWYNRSNSQLSFTSKVNIAARCTLDVDTRAMKMHVQMYYTQNGSGSTDKLHAAILQNNLIAPQVNAENVATQNLGNGNYLHHNVLCHMLTPLSGESVSPIVAGSLINKHFTYTIPATFGNFNGTYGSFPAVLENLSFLAFITDSISTVEQVQAAQIIYTSNQPNRIIVQELIDVQANTNYCGANGKLRFNCLNIGNNNIHTISGYYTLNNGQAIDFTKNFNALTPQEEIEFMLTEMPLEEGINTTKIVINTINNSTITPIEKYIVQYRPININANVNVAHINIIYPNSSDNTLYTVRNLYTNQILLEHRGPRDNYLGTADFEFPLENGHCYEVDILTTIMPHTLITQPGLSLEIDNTVLLSHAATNRAYLDFKYRFTYNGYQAIAIEEANNIAENIQLYPNPSKGILNIALELKSEKNVEISILNVLGQIVYQAPTTHLNIGENKISLALEHLHNQMYFLRLSNEKEQITLPFIIEQ